MPKALPGLPSYGPLALSFPRSDSSREGYVVEFETAFGTWIGNFAEFDRRLPSVIHEEFGPRFVFVVAGGEGYMVDVDLRKLVWDAPFAVYEVWFQKELPALIISNGTGFKAFDAHRTLWKSRRISWDGFRSVRREGLTMIGEAYFPALSPEGEWIPFQLDLRTGSVIGGSYNGPDLDLI